MSSTRNTLLKEYDLMETERQALLHRLSSVSAAKLEAKPNPETWSVTEVIYHLKVAEEAALQYMKKKLEVGGHSKATVSAGLKQRLLNFIISLPIKFKAPKVAQIPEGTSVSYQQAKSEWNSVRSELRKHYETVDEQFISNELFKHPITGKMNLIQSVRFMRKHMNRHIGQIDRLVD